MWWVTFVVLVLAVLGQARSISTTCHSTTRTPVALVPDGPINIRATSSSRPTATIFTTVIVISTESVTATFTSYVTVTRGSPATSTAVSTTPSTIVIMTTSTTTSTSVPTTMPGTISTSSTFASSTMSASMTTPTSMTTPMTMSTSTTSTMSTSTTPPTPMIMGNYRVYNNYAISAMIIMARQAQPSYTGISFQDCLEMCTADSNCVSASYVIASMTCTLFQTSNTNLVPQAGSQAAIKVSALGPTTTTSPGTTMSASSGLSTSTSTTSTTSVPTSVSTPTTTAISVPSTTTTSTTAIISATSILTTSTSSTTPTASTPTTSTISTTSATFTTLATSMSTTSSTSTTPSMSTTTTASTTSTTSSTPTTTLPISTTTSATTTTTSSTSTTTTSRLATTTSSTTTTTTTTPSTTSSSTTTTTSTTSSTSSGAVVTNKAYIDTILRHHNRHRLNHTADAITWNTALAETARKIANLCVYEHNTTIDCDNGGASCYGQNIAAGFPSTSMSSLVSDAFYNSEVNTYTYYGMEPDLNTFKVWGHFTQIVWKTTTNSVGCYSTDCSATGLRFPNGGGQGIAPIFTVCNYGPPGNYVDEFTENVLAPIGLPSIFAGYLCPTTDNCEG